VLPVPAEPDLFSDPRYAVVEAGLPMVCDLRRSRGEVVYRDLELGVDTEEMRLFVAGPDVVVGLDDDPRLLVDAIDRWIDGVPEGDVLAEFRVVVASDDVDLQAMIRALELAPSDFERAVVTTPREEG
jgi:hypothetical protein